VESAFHLTDAEKAAAADLASTRIHIDPVDIESPEMQHVRYELKKIIRAIDPALALHDLYLIKNEDLTTSVTFDLVVPYQFPTDLESLVSLIDSRLKSIDPAYTARITLDRN
jgi:hypothetical protein